MSRKRDREDEEPTLFDLPLDESAERTPSPGPREAAEPTAPEPFRGAGEESLPRSPRSAPPVSVRLLAGCADLAIHLALGIVLLFGARLLGVAAGLGDWPPIAIFLSIFSFLYSVLPLAFWGQTPGMAWAGIEARALDGESLTFAQTVRRWLGGMLSVALLGLPLLLARSDGRTLADRLSESRTLLTD